MTGYTVERWTGSVWRVLVDSRRSSRAGAEAYDAGYLRAHPGAITRVGPASYQPSDRDVDVRDDVGESNESLGLRERASGDWR